ncbi:hypothetical protein T02_8981 [Trichinella nativa]|uniref:Uncharacterized protein n=1 Tax=Trichinella nativa TaxID=6335 RepID=A0A0V1L464_9BILA|nr:hypothetical protein T02_8981 [Trichinella nativa]
MQKIAFLKYERVQSFISILPFTAALTLICLELPSIDAVYSMLKKNPSEEMLLIILAKTAAWSVQCKKRAIEEKSTKNFSFSECKYFHEYEYN